MRLCSPGLWLSALCVLSACGLPKYTPAPQLPGAPLAGGERRAVMNGLTARAAAIRSWRGLSRTVWRQGRESARLRHVIVFVKPDRLRVETLPAGGAFTLNLLAVRGGRAIFLDAGSKIAYETQSAARLLEEALGLPVSEGELMSYLSGCAPGGGGEIYGEARGGGLLLVQDGRKYFFIDPVTHGLRRVHVRGNFDDLLQYEIEYGAYRVENGVAVPGQMEIRIPRKDITLTLTLSPLAVNPPVSEALFEVAVPDDFEARAINRR